MYKNPLQPKPSTPVLVRNEEPITNFPYCCVIREEDALVRDKEVYQYLEFLYSQYEQGTYRFQYSLYYNSFTFRFKSQTDVNLFVLQFGEAFSVVPAEETL
jgi:hypothetical protein